jgi:hypothetical protein
MSQTLSPSITRSRLEGPARQRLSLSQRDATEHDLPSPWSSRRMFGLELAGHIRQQIAASRLHGEGYRKLWSSARVRAKAEDCSPPGHKKRAAKYCQSHARRNEPSGTDPQPRLIGAHCAHVKR